MTELLQACYSGSLNCCFSVFISLDMCIGILPSVKIFCFMRQMHEAKLDETVSFGMRSVQLRKVMAIKWIVATSVSVEGNSTYATGNFIYWETLIGKRLHFPFPRKDVLPSGPLVSRANLDVLQSIGSVCVSAFPLGCDISIPAKLKNSKNILFAAGFLHLILFFHARKSTYDD